MPTNTPNFNLVKATQAEFYNVDVPNNNMDIIDSILKALQDAITSDTTGQDLENLSQVLTTHLADKASKTSYGHMKVGSGLSVSDGVVSAEIPTISDASTTQKGVVQLSNNTNGTSQTLAITEKALKEVNDNSTKKVEGYWPSNDANTINASGAFALTGTGVNGPPVADGWSTILNATVLEGRGFQLGTKWNDDTRGLYYRAQNGLFSTWNKILTANDNTVPKLATGSYIGDQTNNRMIGLPFTPKLVIVYQTGVNAQWNSVPAGGFTLGTLKGFVKIGGDSTGPGAGTGKQGITTNGFLISARIYPTSGPQDGYADTGNNTTGNVYEYVAIG